MAAAFDWTDERKAALRRMMDDGLSAAHCAAELSRAGSTVTRSAVLGKAFRLGWSWEASKKPPAKSPSITPPRPSRLRSGVTAPISPPRPTAAAMKPRIGWPKPANAESVNIFGLNSKTCRWPLWSEHAPPPIEAKMYCGREVDREGSSWCAGCRKLLTVRAGTVGEAMAADPLDAERAMRRQMRAW